MYLSSCEKIYDQMLNALCWATANLPAPNAQFCALLFLHQNIDKLFPAEKSFLPQPF